MRASRSLRLVLNIELLQLLLPREFPLRKRAFNTPKFRPSQKGVSWRWDHLLPIEWHSAYNSIPPDHENVSFWGDIFAYSRVVVSIVRMLVIHIRLCSVCCIFLAHKRDNTSSNPIAYEHERGRGQSDNPRFDGLSRVQLLHTQSSVKMNTAADKATKHLIAFDTTYWVPQLTV